MATLILRHDLLVLGEYRSASRMAFATVHADQRAVEREGPRISPDRPVSAALMPGVNTGPYLAAVDDLGAPSPETETASRTHALAVGLVAATVVVALGATVRI